jgi:hypothetical protein
MAFLCVSQQEKFKFKNTTTSQTAWALGKVHVKNFLRGAEGEKNFFPFPFPAI